MSWGKVKIGSLIEILSGYAFDSKRFNESNGMPIIRIRDIKRSYSETFYDGEFDNRYVIKKGDVLIGMDGEFNISEWKGVNSLLNQRVCKINSYDKKIDKRYLLHFLPLELKYIEDKTSFVTVKHLSVKDINDIEILLPPLPIQKRISEILDAAAALKIKDQELLKKYDELSQAIFIDMFGDPEKNEKRWEVKKLGEVTTIRRGASPRPIDKFIGNDVPWIKIGDGTKGGNIYIETTKVKITTAGSKKSVLLKPGSLIFANCGVSLGFARILKISGCIHDGWLSIEDIDDKILNKIFLLKYINFLTDFFRKTAPEGTQPNLNSGIMKEHKIILPPIKLQNKFSDLIFAMEESKRKNIAIEKCGENLFQTLIQKAFNGELVN
jgi:type I restriction enzyme, S subunit